MNIKEIMKRLEEIKARKLAIQNELKDADEKRILEFNSEVDNLDKEVKELRAKTNLIGKLDSKEEDVPDKEARALEFKNSGRMTISATEARSILVSSGELAKPTAVGTEINEPQTAISSVLDMIDVEDMTGVAEWDEPYMKSWQAAGSGTDGTAPDPTDPVFRKAKITPHLVDVLTYISRSIRKQTPVQYEAKIRKGALMGMKKKVIEQIIKGNGSTQLFGIPYAVNTEESPELIAERYLVTSSTINEKTLRKIVFAYGGDEAIGGGAVLILNKNDLVAFGDVRGTNEKKAVYDIIPDGSNPNTGLIKEGGLSVRYVIDSHVTALSDSTYSGADIPTMIYGVPGCYKLGLFGDYEVRVSEDYKFAEGLLAIKGEVMAGGNVVYDKGFLVVTLTTA